MSDRESAATKVNRRVAERPPDQWIQRFGRTERFAHWWTVLMLSIAVVSGMGMGDDGGSGPLLVVHVGAVALMGSGFVAALVFGERRALLDAAQSLFVFDRRDAAWLRARVRDPFHPDANPSWGMFNTGQKALAWTLAASVMTVIVTGIVSWSHGEGGLHGAAVLLTGILLAAHIFMALLNRATRPALHGMVFGDVRRSWAAEHHGAWLQSRDSQRSRHEVR